jgi:hypothetical protein
LAQFICVLLGLRYLCLVKDVLARKAEEFHILALCKKKFISHVNNIVDVRRHKTWLSTSAAQRGSQHAAPDVLMVVWRVQVRGGQLYSSCRTLTERTASRANSLFIPHGVLVSAAALAVVVSLAHCCCCCSLHQQGSQTASLLYCQHLPSAQLVSSYLLALLAPAAVLLLPAVLVLQQLPPLLPWDLQQ